MMFTKQHYEMIANRDCSESDTVALRTVLDYGINVVDKIANSLEASNAR